MSIQIQNLQANPSAIHPHGTVTLHFNILSNPGTPVNIYYQLNHGNNAYIDENGRLYKEVARHDHLNSNSLVISQPLEIVKIPSTPDYRVVRLYVQVENALNNYSDIDFVDISFI